MLSQLEVHENMTASFFDYQVAVQSWSHCEDDERNLINYLIRKMSIIPGDILIEPGCGAGKITPYLSRAVGDDGWIISFDISPEMIKLAEKRTDCPNSAFRKASVHNIPLPNKSVDVAVCFNCFHNFDCPLTALKEIVRVLRENGKLSIAFTKTVYDFDGEYFLPKDKLHRRLISLHELIRCLQFYGFIKGEIILSDASFLLITQRRYSDPSADTMIESNVN